MESFHHSRGRIFFEVLCALAVSASLAGAWVQTGASALVAAAAVAALYGLVHAFDLRRRTPAEAEEPQRIDAPPVPTAAEPPPVVAIEEAQVVEPAASEARDSPKPKAPRKTRARKPKVALAVVDEPEMAAPEPAHEPEVAPPEPEHQPQVADRPDDVIHAPVAPLFEPEPFVRQQRTIFGRKAG